MGELSGVIFDMQTMDATVAGGGDFLWKVVFHCAVSGEREIVLGNLEAHWEIGVEVVLAVEVTAGGDRAPKSKSSTDSLRYSFTIGDREGSWMSHTDFTDSGIGIPSPCIVIASAEHLRPCVHLCVDF